MNESHEPTRHEVEIEVHDDVVFYDIVEGPSRYQNGTVFRAGAVDGITCDALAALGSGRHMLELPHGRRTGEAWPEDEVDMAFLKFRFQRFIERNFDRRSISALIMAFAPRNVARIEPLLLPWMREGLLDYARRVEQAGRTDDLGITYFGTSHVTELIPAANITAILAWAKTGHERSAE